MFPPGPGPAPLDLPPDPTGMGGPPGPDPSLMGAPPVPPPAPPITEPLDLPPLTDDQRVAVKGWIANADKDHKRYTELWKRNLDAYAPYCAWSDQAKDRGDYEVNTNVDFRQAEQKKAQLWFDTATVQLTPVEPLSRLHAFSSSPQPGQQGPPPQPGQPLQPRATAADPASPPPFISTRPCSTHSWAPMR